MKTPSRVRRARRPVSFSGYVARRERAARLRAVRSFCQHLADYGHDTSATMVWTVAHDGGARLRARLSLENRQTLLGGLDALTCLTKAQHASMLAYRDMVEGVN